MTFEKVVIISDCSINAFVPLSDPSKFFQGTHGRFPRLCRLFLPSEAVRTGPDRTDEAFFASIVWYTTFLSIVFVVYFVGKKDPAGVELESCAKERTGK